jgi:hypothetical protein
MSFRRQGASASTEGSFADFPLWMKRESVAPQFIPPDIDDASRCPILTRLQARPFESISVLLVLGRYCSANTKKKNPALPQNPIYKTIRIEYQIVFLQKTTVVSQLVRSWECGGGRKDHAPAAPRSERPHVAVDAVLQRQQPPIVVEAHSDFMPELACTNDHRIRPSPAI